MVFTCRCRGSRWAFVATGDILSAKSFNDYDCLTFLRQLVVSRASADLRCDDGYVQAASFRLAKDY